MRVNALMGRLAGMTGDIAGGIERIPAPKSIRQLSSLSSSRANYTSAMGRNREIDEADGAAEKQLTQHAGSGAPSRLPCKAAAIERILAAKSNRSNVAPGAPSGRRSHGQKQQETAENARRQGARRLIRRSWRSSRRWFCA